MISLTFPDNSREDLLHPTMRSAGAAACCRQSTVRCGQRNGFSLIELLLVLALIVAIGAITLPMLKGPLENQRLRKAADQLRTHWARARVEAMQSGRIQVFQYQLNSGLFRVEPWHADSDYLEGDAETSSFAAAGVQAPTDPAQIHQQQLPEGVFFAGGQAESTGRSWAIEQTVQTDLTLGPPILFYPDGTTSTAQVILANGQQNGIAVRLRGLTGAATVGSLTNLTELGLTPF